MGLFHCFGRLTLQAPIVCFVCLGLKKGEREMRVIGHFQHNLTGQLLNQSQTHTKTKSHGGPPIVVDQIDCDQVCNLRRIFCVFQTYEGLVYEEIVRNYAPFFCKKSLLLTWDSLTYRERTRPVVTKRSKYNTRVIGLF